MSYECLWAYGKCFHEECGAWPEDLDSPSPSPEDYCAYGGHAYHGDDLEVGRCYCGARQYELEGKVKE